ncbi:GntR family transcriptional regulator [Paludifilum halophilum]|uniref:GntR family transcriptional regulator n=1 Tax=Paludifilum halophilum TaxID=1642702 RepID=A0A235B4R8_9BACL|nr:GntR family transcriptional regulator [Paludifilum halophilum]OYD07306.1 GntR family transcriptional regulator [Paludifilum halophilum]
MHNTKHNQVKEAIQSWILEGKVAPRQKIKSENEMVEIFGVSRHTVRQAIGDLVHEGWLYREQGRGTFCSDRTLSDQKPNKLIGIITTYISDYIFPSIIRGAESYLNSKGYSILLASTNNNVKEEKACLQTILNKNIDGLIIEPTKSALYNENLNYYLGLEANNTPYVMINAYYPQLQSPSLTVNDEQGGHMAAEHLIHLGHRRIIGFFKTDDLQGLHRMQGFLRAHREHRVTIDPELIVPFNTEEKEEKPKEALRRILRMKSEKPTAVFCYNDEIALNILDVVREQQLKVPEDLSIVGYDDSHFAQASEVKLTSVKHPKMVMGETAAQVLIEAIQEKGREIEPVVFQPELIVRSSTRKIE